MPITRKNQYLTNVAIIRPVLIVLLVLYHSFAIYCGGWNSIDGFPEIKIYWWIGKATYAFMLEMFVFLSGYVFGYQVLKKGNEVLKLKIIVKIKFKRLLIPCMIFSFLYIAIFRGFSSQSITLIVYDIIAGAGHMWFLSMLFWCFMFIWVIEKVRIKPIFALPMLFFFSVCPQLPFPFHISLTFYYMLFFYVGYIIKRNEIDEIWLYETRISIMLTIAFLILFPCLTLFQQNMEWLTEDDIISKIMRILLLNQSKVIYASLGIAMMLSWVGGYEKRQIKEIPKWVSEVGSLCMGVYLLQQFIIKAIYDFTYLPLLLGPYFLPWGVSTIALLFSLIVSWLLRKSKFGRVIIG